jgi:serine/threonine protein kinase
MQQIADGLSVLHGNQVILRELAPSRVLIAEADGQPILTDFELAKLLTGEPTVRPDEPWPDDPYRAPEVESGEVSFSADLYSWARILVHAACGFLPPSGEDVAALTNAGLPKRVWGIARSCLELDKSNRPADVSKVQAALRNWVNRGSN